MFDRPEGLDPCLLGCIGSYHAFLTLAQRIRVSVVTALFSLRPLEAARMKGSYPPRYVLQQKAVHDVFSTYLPRLSWVFLSTVPIHINQIITFHCSALGEAILSAQRNAPPCSARWRVPNAF